MKCREIGEILLSDSIPADILGYLRYLIHEHHTLLRKLAPTNITPKFHFLIHYPSIIQQHGPPKRYWTMRFESKHQYFKDLVKRTRNFQNLTLTLSTRCQSLQAVHFSSDFEPRVVVGPGQSKPLSSFAAQIRGSLQESAGLGYFEDESVFSANWIVVEGTKLSLKTVFLTDVVHEEVPLFCEISYILCVCSKWYIGGNQLTPLSFCTKSRSYRCEESSTFVFKHANSIIAHCPVLSYNSAKTILMISICNFQR